MEYIYFFLLQKESLVIFQIDSKLSAHCWRELWEAANKYPYLLALIAVQYLNVAVWYGFRAMEHISLKRVLCLIDQNGYQKANN